MSFRTRVLLVSLVAVLVPVTLVGLVLRREVEERLRDQYAERVEALAAVIEEDLDRERERIGRRLGAISERLAGDSRFRAAAGGGDDRRYVLDYAGDAMRLTGLSVLQIHDVDGRIVSSGHFRNAFDVVAPALPRILAGLPGRTAVARVPTAGGEILALVRLDSVRLGGRTYRLVGGARIGEAFLARLDRDPELSVRFDRPGGGPPGDGPERSVGADPGGRDDTAGARPEAVEALARSVVLPYVDVAAARERDGAALPVAGARFEIAAGGATLRDVRRSTGIAFALILAGAAGLALLVAFRLSARVTRPLEALAAKAGRVDLDRLDVDFSTDRKDEIGRLAGTLGAMTRRLRAGARELRDAERRAALGELARQVNHDVRNGLAPIRNVLRHLDRVADERPERLAGAFRDRRDTLDASVGYLEDLAGDYERLSRRAGAGRADPNEVVAGVVEAASAGSEVSVRAKPDSSAPPVRCDPVALRRILENLVVNAKEACGPTGDVAVRVRPDRADREQVRIVVRDTGAGMSEEVRSRAFDGFFTTKADGTGLGLSVVRRLVRDVGGRVRLESEEGRGTRVTLELPAVADPDPGRAAATGGAGRGG